VVSVLSVGFVHYGVDVGIDMSMCDKYWWKVCVINVVVGVCDEFILAP
jgi:hypothetical protein